MRTNKVWSIIWLVTAIGGIAYGLKDAFVAMALLGSVIYRATDDILQAIERKP